MIRDDRTDAERLRDLTDYGMCPACGGSPMSQLRTDPNSGYASECVCPNCHTNPSATEVLRLDDAWVGHA